MAAVWVSVKKSLDCKTEASEVHHPTKKTKPASLRDVIQTEKKDGSIGSSQINKTMNGFGVVKREPRWRVLSGHGGGFDGSSHLICQMCRHKFKNAEAVEAHHITYHSVTELPERHSSRKIVELICGPALSGQIQTILRVTNTQNTLTQFEHHRDTVKLKATKLTTNHPRCLADGNELLRFHGAALACTLGHTNSPLRLCTMQSCGVCKILRHGFSPDRFGVLTTCAAEKAMGSVGGGKSARRGLIMCRVIGGRVCKGVDDLTSYDSLVGEFGCESNRIEELYLFDPKALLPCFVIICTD